MNVHFVTYVCIIVQILRFVHFILRVCRIQETRKVLFVEKKKEDIKEGVASRMLALQNIPIDAIVTQMLSLSPVDF